MPLRQVHILPAVSPQLTTAFGRTVSPERWKTYQIAAGFHDELAHRLYLWNAAIGQSFHFPLQTVEVALRNVVHDAMMALYGPEWAMDRQVMPILHKKQRYDIKKAARRHQSIYQEAATTTQIVASLSLGFWAAMLRKGYHAKIWQQQEAIAFPALAPEQSVHDISAATNRIQSLRNRIFHQEPLIGRDLSADYADILHVLGAICPETKDWMRSNSSAMAVMRERPR